MDTSSRFLPLEAARHRTLMSFGLVIGGSLLLTLSAKLQVPFWPVPMTLQTGVVLLFAILMGPRLALATIGLYLAQGAAGLPVFAGTPEKGLGLAYMMGPTGGYMVGWLLAAAFLGWAAQHLRRAMLLFGAALLAVALNYTPGIIWLAQFTGWENAFALGAVPFILGDVVKAALAVALALAVRGAVTRQR
ncbi:MAG: biotin transporter BioY [Geminicoccaceae bacterium]|nr:MAG: biotin transporter BioY [Geminicoccaceae bacterium]